MVNSNSDEYKIVKDVDEKPMVQFIIRYPWEFVVEAYHERFPKNPRFPYIAQCEEKRKQVSSDEITSVLRLNRKEMDDSTLEKLRSSNLYHQGQSGKGDKTVTNIERRVTIDLSVDMPGWLTSIIGKPSCIFLEHTIVDSEKRMMRIFSENVSWNEKLKVLEECVYCAHPDNPEWTLKQLKPSLELQVRIPFVGSKIEKWCESTFVSKTSEAFKMECSVLEEKVSGRKVDQQPEHAESDTEQTQKTIVDEDPLMNLALG